VGANLTQTAEPTKAKTAIIIDIVAADELKWRIKAKSIAGGSEPHVPGAIGSLPRPKHDTTNLLIVVES
jgi:hypothetical protein